jgi:archaeosine-15-forming tRNA-guanine transglycosylase
MTYYAGLDGSLRSKHICVVDDDGELFAEGKTDTEVADIIAFSTDCVEERPSNET